MLTINDKKGFTLIEVLTAMVILSIGLLGTGALLGGIIRSNNVSQNITIATMLAQDKMESMKTLGYSGLSETTTTTTENYGTISGYSDYKRITTVEIDTPEAGMKSVTVEAHWSANRQPVTLNMIVTR